MKYKLNKAPKILLNVLCRELKKRAKSRDIGLSDRYFGSTKRAHQTWLPKWTLRMVENACSELAQIGFLKIVEDEGVKYIYLTNEGIVYKTGSKYKDRLAMGRSKLMLVSSDGTVIKLENIGIVPNNTDKLIFFADINNWSIPRLSRYEQLLTEKFGKTCVVAPAYVHGLLNTKLMNE